MSPSPIDDETVLEELRSVVGWFKDAKVEKKDAAGDILRCVDNDRFTKWTPFLEQMNLHKEGNGYALLRILGTVKIEKEKGFDTIFFPFRDVEIAGETVHFGEFVRLTETQLLTTNLDCLIVVVPALTRDQ